MTPEQFEVYKRVFWTGSKDIESVETMLKVVL